MLYVCVLCVLCLNSECRDATSVCDVSFPDAFFPFPCAYPESSWGSLPLSPLSNCRLRRLPLCLCCVPSLARSSLCSVRGARAGLALVRVSLLSRARECARPLRRRIRGCRQQLRLRCDGRRRLERGRAARVLVVRTAARRARGRARPHPSESLESTFLVRLVIVVILPMVSAPVPV